MRPLRATPKKRAPISRKSRIAVDPSRLAVAGLERLKALLQRTGNLGKLAEGVSLKELGARASFSGRALPPSYSAAMRLSGSFDDGYQFLSATEMAQISTELLGQVATSSEERLIPFARMRQDGSVLCFDPRSTSLAGAAQAELSVVVWRDGETCLLSSHFGDWIDSLADEREEAAEQAAELPRGLRSLLLQLGFQFEDPIVGKVLTGDVQAITSLIGDELAREVRGTNHRLFDATGKALLRLNLEDFSLSCTLRTGTFLYEAEDVFRWLRTFRDENFFGEAHREPSHPDTTRDLTQAPREEPLVLQGMRDLPLRPAERHVFLQASGLSPRNYFLLARSLVDPRRPTVVFLAQGEQLRPVATFEETVFAMHAAQDGTLWCLTEQGTVLELGSEHKRVYALPRPVGNQTQWRGIGEYEGRVLVWGTAALLEFNGELFVPFSPAPGIEKHECVVAVARAHEELKVLVKGQGAGAVARFDGTHWVPIEEHQVLEEDLVDYDFWQGRELLLGREGHLWTVEPKDGGAPRRLPWNRSAPAFLVPTGSFRCPLGVRAVEGATLVASVGGVLVVQEADPEPLFHAAPNNHDNVKLSRLAAPSGYDAQASVMATFGGHVWLWESGEFHVLDMTSW